VRLEGVQAGKPAHVAGVRTAFGKRPVRGPVRVGPENLEGDAQADRRYHGGPDMAVLAYSADHYPAWREELGWPDLPLGGFGENLSVAGASEEAVCIGDLWRAGSAVLQVASPRRPCRKIAAYWGRPELLRRVRRTGRIGWYLRVLEEGSLQQGMEVELIGRPHPEWTVRRAFAVALQRRGPAALALAEVPALSPRWRAWLRGEPARV
jgi:MOSC domain-containing protein YiiM